MHFRQYAARNGNTGVLPAGPTVGLDTWQAHRALRSTLLDAGGGIE